MKSSPGVLKNSIALLISFVYDSSKTARNKDYFSFCADYGSIRHTHMIHSIIISLIRKSEVSLLSVVSNHVRSAQPTHAADLIVCGYDLLNCFYRITHDLFFLRDVNH